MKIETAERLAHRRAERRYALVVAALSVLVGAVLYTSAANAAYPPAGGPRMFTVEG